MARPIKEGLDYFPFDVSFFSDKKIRRLKVKFGASGICMYIYLLCQIYGDKGYFLECDDDLISDISDALGITEELTRQIMKYLLSRSLLCEIHDSKLAKPVTIISARSIQRRFQEAKKGCKRNVFVKAGYWLLEKAETLSLIKVCPDNGFSENNNGFSEKNTSNSEKNTIKESKGNKSKVNDMTSDGMTALEGLSREQYDELAAMSSRRSVEKYIVKIIDWQNRTGRLVKDPFSQISKWILEDRAKHSSADKKKETSYDLDEWEDFANNFDPGGGS